MVLPLFCSLEHLAFKLITLEGEAQPQQRYVTLRMCTKFEPEAWSLNFLATTWLSSRRCMTSCRESRKEAATLTILLMTRKTLNIGKRGRPQNTWRREFEKDIKRTGQTWKQLERIAQDRRD